MVTDAHAEALLLRALPDAIARDLLDAATLGTVPAWGVSVRAVLDATPPPPSGGDFRGLRAAVRGGAAASEAPFRAGWTMATRLRDSLGLTQDTPVAGLRKKLEGMCMHGSTTLLARTPLRGVVRIGDGGFSASLREESHFAWARALGLSLLGGRERLLTDARTRSQSVARALAAEVVAPVACVRARIHGAALTWDELTAIAGDLEAPPQAVLHQVENHDLAVVE